ncbi:c-type cytochrome [Fuerstiella marisgermanici]|nr:cytochrome c [Fuerstiella marisgermanici]
MRLFTIPIATALMSLTLSGCERAEPIRWTSSELVSELPDEALREQLVGIVNENSGSAREPRMISESKDDFDFNLHLKHGQQVYMKRCVQCHGVSGDGNGEAAKYLYPKPRDYTRGIFKFTSTPYGNKPRREDLIAVVRRGVTGTSMPRFNRIKDKDVNAVVDYVMVLAQRGELEYQLAMEAEAAEELDEDFIPEFIEDVVNRWQTAKTSLTQPLTPQPELTEARAKQGREAFLSKGCSKCHGDDGRGHTKDNIGKDSWGHATRAADLTSGMLHGGQEPIDIYRRILNGINGTPMPGFKSSLQSEPETIWNLVAYVLEVSNRRRYGTKIPAGLMKPYDQGASEETE